ncbi:hypothetical protein C2E23DRAFT_309440 [Lenzites betulinus]|nr:hypothetical protein C2E23DRAFT_309440 [Lenzites betulinus]
MAANSTKIFAAAFGSLGVILLAVLIWRLALRHRRRAHRRTDTVTPRPFLAPPGAAPPKPPSLSARPLTSAALAPLRRPSSTSHAPGYSTAATAPSSPESPWSPEGPAPVRRPRSTDKPPRRLLLRSPAPMSPPSARVLPHRDRGAYEFLLSGSLSPPRETFGFGGDAEMGELGLPPSQMPPPYHFLDLH